MTGRKSAKVSKGSVNYRPAALLPGAKRCGGCSMFSIQGRLALVGSCTLVAGEIKRTDVCDRWAAK